ncbi:MAG TPA: Crp/Fnr family transcriptional regulator [bacterium]|nr:Crp/Fnr family transcriptional regulator [bacterium]
MLETFMSSCYTQVTLGRWRLALAKRKPAHFKHLSTLEKPGAGKRVVEYRPKDTLFQQGDAADAVFYVRDGKIKLTTTSSQGREAIVAIVGAGDFVGEGSLAGQPLRMATAIAMTACSCVRIDKTVMNQLLHQRGVFSEQFMAYLLGRNIRIEADLVDQLFNSSEKRLARTLLLLAQYGKEGQPQSIVPQISQETLAGIIGTTRSRVSHFMNKFRKLGFIEYNGGLSVHSSLLSVILLD